jgi:hypothetical protein
MWEVDLHQVDTPVSAAEEAEEDGGVGEAKGGSCGARRFRRSVSVIVRNEVAAFAREPLFNRLIKHKWNRFGRSMHVWRTLLPYGLILATFTAAAILRATEIREDWAHRVPPDGACTRGVEAGVLATLRGGDGWRMATLALQAALACPLAPALLYTGLGHRRLETRDLDLNQDGQFLTKEVVHFVGRNLLFVLDVLAAAALAAAAAARCAACVDVELEVLAVAGLLLYCNLLNLLLPFKSLGALIITVQRMLAGDVLRFVAVFTVLQCGFGLALLVLFQGGPDPAASHGWDQVRRPACEGVRGPGC